MTLIYDPDEKPIIWNTRVILGFLFPIILSPMIWLTEKPEAARCLFCISVMALFWSLEMAPFMATSMLPLLALPVLGVMSADDMANQYFSKPVLEKFLNFSFALVLREATLVYTRAAFFMLRRFGARVRSLLISFLILTLVLVQVADAGLVALVLVFTVVIVISEIQNDIIREEQFKAYAQKYMRGANKVYEEVKGESEDQNRGVVRNSVAFIRMKSSADSPRRDSPAVPGPTNSNRPTSVVARMAPNAISSPTLVPHPMEGRRRLNSLHIQVDARSEAVPDPFCTLPPFPVPPATTAFGSRKSVDKAALAKRKISVLEKGKVIRPGDESPESLASPLSPEQHKKTPIRKPSSVFGSAKKYLMRRLTAATLYDTSYLDEKLEWEKERYTTIRKDLLIGIALTASLGSIASIKGNDCNVFLDSYMESHPWYMGVSTRKCLLVTLPVAVFAVSFCWIILLMGYLERYDADEDEDARYAINQVLKHRHHQLKPISPSECLIITLLALWCISQSGFGQAWLSEDHRILPPSIGTLAGILLFIVVFAMPDLKGLQSGMVEWRVLIANMPWAVLLVYGGVQCMTAAFKVSGLAATISDLVLELQFMDPTISQLILTLIASVLTEVMDNTGTCAILVPPSARLAEMSHVDPVYYALPVTIAASTSLVMPASNLAITVVISYADITVSDLLLPGLMIKCFTITAVLLAMNTIGQLVFHFSRFPENLKALGQNGSTTMGPTISNINTS